MPHISLAEVHLHYGDDLIVHTATSGKISELHELHLKLTYPCGTVGEGGARINIAYLTGRTSRAARREVTERLPGLILSDDPAEDLSRLDTLVAAAPTLRLLLSSALTDAAAKRAGQSAADFLDPAPRPPPVATNQTLFFAEPSQTCQIARRFAREGFRELKLRMGTRDPASDVALMAALRTALGPEIELSADLNGAWDRATLRAHISALNDAKLAYLEQPLPAHDWDGLLEAAANTPFPIMLDESVRSVADVTRIAESSAPFHLHLKLAKLHGIDRLMEAARVARQADLSVMVGQMNEGTLCTAAALAAARAVHADRAELYGAYGLKNDTHHGLTYADGAVTAGPRGFGA